MTISSRKKSKLCQFFFTVIVVISMLFPPGTVVVAQDETPPLDTPPSEFEQIDPIVIEQAMVEIPLPLESPEPFDLTQPTVEIPQEEVIVVPTEAIPMEEFPAIQTVEIPLITPEPVQEDSDTAEEVFPEVIVAEVVETLSENNLTVVDENGNPLTLASDQAAEIISSADPYFTVGSKTYGWTNTGTQDNPTCSTNVPILQENCTYSTNPINDAINSSLYTGQTLTIENGNYTSTDVAISKSVILRPQSNMTVKKITLNIGSAISWEFFGSNQFYLTSQDVIVNEGAHLPDAMEVIAPGGTITLGRGIFDDDRGATIDEENVTITGQGAAHTIIRPISSCTTGSCQQYFIVGASGVKIHDLTLDGQNRVSSGISVTDRTDVEIYNNTITKTINAIRIKDSEVDITGNNLFGNSNGIYIEDLDYGGDAVVAHKNRIFSNTSNGIYYFASGSSDPVVDAVDNWWGCNNGPNTDDCDSTNTNRENRIKYLPYLMLGLTTDDSSINIGETSTLTAFLYSSSVGPTSPVSGIPWFDSLVTISRIAPNLGDLAGNLFTAALAGIQDFRATLDNAIISTQVVVSQLTCPDGQINIDGQCTPIVIGCMDPTAFNHDPTANTEGTCEAVKVGCMDPTAFNYDPTANTAGTCESVKVGCMDETAFNFDPTANTAGTCEAVKVGCMDETAFNFDPIANTAGICEAVKVGCMDPTAFNYDPAANTAGTCETVKVGCMDDAAFNYDPTANTEGTCEAVKVGCMDPTAFNYDPTANTEGTCEAVKVGCMDETAFNFDPTANTAGTCEAVKIGCMDETAFNFDPSANTAGTCEAVKVGCMDPTAFNYDASANTAGTCEAVKVGCMDPTAFNYDPTANTVGTCEAVKVGCMDETAFNFDPTANTEGTCEAVKIGCMDETAFNFDPSANTAGTCEAVKVGCMDPTAFNYDASANTAGTCEAVKVGCMDPTAFNYDPTANTVGTCEAVKVGCMDETAFNFDSTANTAGSCEAVKVGCMDETAFNYDPTANTEGTCEAVKVGCMDPTAFNYDASANTAGTCEAVKVGCMDPTAFNYDPTANTVGTCEAVKVGCMDETAFNFDSTANTAGSCEAVKVGCMDPTAFNYDPTANTEGTCEAVIFGCIDPTAFDYDPTANTEGTCTHKPDCTDSSLYSGYNAETNTCIFKPTHNPSGGSDLLGLPVLGTSGVGVGGLIPVTGGLNKLSCTEANTLVLPNGDKVVFSDPLCDFEANLSEEKVDSLPEDLPAGLTFDDAFTLVVQKSGKNFNILPNPITMTLSFAIPAEQQGKSFSILYWGASLKGGLGDWVEIPAQVVEKGTEVMVQLADETTLNFTGIFVLAVHK